ncbi:Eukaryotic translation initiation factor eIF-1 [Cyphellophora attinorum]|uniref:Eukaryotic translation initiation factor eIF-1 n=1 Tax=Cyphellophora attinorum TaxID=1664694 RepID=A0A0N1HH51_9EURO|nr:Eukaryotic translation initiation factor eIF-1 [Phialophora attinorum]KPI45734.1 Eukaryotic translation initiation factor eIF-1 [Phialophora attinorum]
MPRTPSATTPSPKAADDVAIVQRVLEALDIDLETRPSAEYVSAQIQTLKPLHTYVEDVDDYPVSPKQAQEYIHIRIQQRKGRETLTTVQGIPKKFNQRKILKELKNKLTCNGSITTDKAMGEGIQLHGDQRKGVQEFLVAKKDGLGLDLETINVHGF